jgi:hypothetical protein
VHTSALPGMLVEREARHPVFMFVNAKKRTFDEPAVSDDEKSNL